MDHLKIPTLVIDHCLCDGCKNEFNKLKKKIPQVHSIEFNTEQRKATISGAVDPAEVMEELARKNIKAKILWEESSPINNHHHHQQKQIVSPKPSAPKIHEQVQVRPHDLAVVHFGDFPSETAGIRIQDEPIVKKTPDCYLNHEHELVEVKGFNKRFTCDGCKEDGFRSRYRCEPCNFDLHHECRFPKLTISPEIHEELVFQFRPQKPPNKRLFCDACGMKIHGCFYKCKAKGMDLHPCCARLKAQVRKQDMVLLLCEKVSSKCLRCREKEPPGTEEGIPGWCYVSKCKKYNIHIPCITQMLHEAWQRGLMDHTGESSIERIDFQLMTVSDRNRGGRGTEALKLISIFRMIVGVLLGDPSVFFGSLMVEFLKQLL